MNIDLGRVTPIYRGSYSAAASYELNDIVLYSDGNLYWHTKEDATVGVAPTDTATWTLAFSGADVETAIETIKENAEAIALGTRNGVPVASGDPYYHNNAAWYASQAQGSAGDAADANTAAQGAKTAAESARDAAAQWATGGTSGTPGATNNAKYYSEQAGESAAQAAASAAASAAQSGLADAFDAAAVYAPGDLVLYNGAVYVFKTAHTGAWDASDVVATTLGARLKEYLPLDGYSESATVGTAEQLIATTGFSDKRPYLLRQTGGGAAVGDRKQMRMVGASMAWNQLVPQRSGATQTDVTFTTDNDSGTITVNGTAGANRTFFLYQDSVANGFKGIVGHKYLVEMTGKDLSSNLHFILTNNGGINEALDSASRAISIITCIDSEKGSGLGLRLNNGSTASNSVVNYPLIIDLTLALGSAIADRAYAMEQSTAGSGIAWLRSYGFIPNGYSAHNPGELLSAKPTAHKVVWFNQWDEQWEVGGYNQTTGAAVAVQANIRSKENDPIRVLANTAYCFTGGAFLVCWYDANDTFIGYSTPGTNDRIRTSPSNAAYCRIMMASAYGTTYHNDICINLSDPARNGQYEPYNATTYELGSTELRGVYKLDSANNIYADGDVREPDGSVAVKYGIVDLGTLTYTKTGGNRFRATVSGKVSGVAGMVCSRYVYEANAGFTTSDGCIGDTNSSSYPSVIFIYDTNYENVDATAFAAAMSGVYLIYELATPTTSTADPYPENIPVVPSGTEQMVDSRAVAVPVGEDTLYPADLRGKLEQLPDAAATDGTYLIQQTSGQMALTPLTSIIPAAPGTDGTYKLTVTVSGGTPTYAWTAE